MADGSNYDFLFKVDILAHLVAYIWLIPALLGRPHR